MANDVMHDTVTAEELREQTAIVYTPVFLAVTNREGHSIETDTVKLKSHDLSTGSVNPQALTEGQTELKHLKVGESQETFNIVVKGQKLYQSGLRGRNQLSNFHNDVIFEYSKVWDREAMLGANGNQGVLNNTSNKAVANTSVALDDANSLAELMTALKIQMSPLGAGQDILVYVYGEALQKFMGRLTPGQETTYRQIAQDAFPNATFVDVPANILEGQTALVNGFVALARAMTKAHDSVLPDVRNTGYNEEDEYEWARYMFGSTHLEVLKQGALVKQPVTIA